MKAFFDKLRLSLLPHKKAVGYALVAFFTLFLLFQCAPARAEGVESRFDAGARVLRGESASIRYSVALPELTPHLRPTVGLGLLGSSNDPDYGPDANNGFFYAGMEARRGRFMLGIGIAKLMRETPYSGTTLQFALEFRARLIERAHWGIDGALFHMSNSGIQKPNPGFDVASIGLWSRW